MCENKSQIKTLTVFSKLSTSVGLARDGSDTLDLSDGETIKIIRTVASKVREEIDSMVMSKLDEFGLNSHTVTTEPKSAPLTVDVLKAAFDMVDDILHPICNLYVNERVRLK